MPFTRKRILRHTKKANTKKKQRAFRKTYAAVRRAGGGEGKAIRIAKSVVKKMGKRKRGKKR